MGVSADAPYLDSAYKLVAYAGRPVMKLSQGKATWPGAKQVHRGPADDQLALRDEPAPRGHEPLLTAVMRDGRRLGPPEPLQEGTRCWPAATAAARGVRPPGLCAAACGCGRRGGLGGQRRCPAERQLGHFFRGAGITILEGWGLTETAGPVTFNLPGAQRIGSVGLPLPGYAVRIAPDGEILVAGPGVFQGHWHDPQATREAFDGRWFRTGDLGRIDDDGFVYLTGRKKELIITATGQNVDPAALEDTVREHWLIDQCVLTGDQRPYIGALITLDPGCLRPVEAAAGRAGRRHHR